jgi:large subunit ribosomal protein L24
MRARIRKNDTVMVIAGRERGKTGKVLRVVPDEDRAVIERLNLVKRHTRARGPQSPHGIVEKEAPIHISNVMIVCDRCNKPVRMGKLILDDGRHVRVCRSCGDQLDR